MNAHVEQSARAAMVANPHFFDSKSAPAVIVVNGTRWTSEVPLTSGDAFNLNEDAAVIVAAIKRKP